MVFSQCKCGNRKHWDSGMPPARCCPCCKCGTVPAAGPELHQDPIPHEWEPHKVETDDGPAVLSRCRWCMKTKAEVAAEAVKEAGG